MKTLPAFLIIILLVAGGVQAQDAPQPGSFPLRKNRGGVLSLGLRSTFSFFGDGGKAVGSGAGGQFRLQIADRVNTEWFFDYITTNIQGLANRRDYHIGWSVMLYPWLGRDRGRFEPVLPYIVAGHCFDLTRVGENRNPSNSARRFSSAIQTGAGAHFHISQHMDLSLQLQYMIHLGRHTHAHIENGQVIIETKKTGKVEGHLLGTVGISYKLYDLW